MILGITAAVVTPFILSAHGIFLTDGLFWAINLPTILAATAIGYTLEGDF